MNSYSPKRPSALFRHEVISLPRKTIFRVITGLLAVILQTTEDKLCVCGLPLCLVAYLYIYPPYKYGSSGE